MNKDWNQRTFKEFKFALKEIRENPDNHNYSKNDIEQIFELEKSYEEIFKPNPEALAFAAKIQENFRKMAEGMDKFHQAISYNLKNLVSRGWYVSTTVISELNLRDVYKFTSKDNVENFETYIFSQIDKKIDKILNDLTSEYPDRSKIFEEMKCLYKNEFFYSFINLCYSQTDGICNAKWKQGFFNTDRNNNFVLTLPYKFDFDPSSMGDIIGKQLNEPRNEFTISSSSFDEQSKRDSFNRHLVVHGHSTNYGTKENAIRAILLLEFVKWLAKQDIKS